MSSATWFRLIGLSFVLISAMLAVPGWTQAPAGKKVALLVGIRDYERSSHFPDLKYTENDVEKLADILRSPGAGFSTIRLLTSTRGAKNPADAPTAANIDKALHALLVGRKPRDTVLIAISGHGIELNVPDPDGKEKNRNYSYFCPSDADLAEKTSFSTGRNKTLLNLEDLFGKLGDCGAGAKLVLMDACRSELKLKRGDAKRSLNAENVTIPRNVGALFSCSSGEAAIEADKLKHGVFFHYVLEGLRGGARNEDNEITWLRLREYVTKKVHKDAPILLGRAITQTPHPIDNIPGESPVLIVGLTKEPSRPMKDTDRPEKAKVVKAWDRQIKNSIGMELVRIPAGKFKMGSTKEEREDVLALLKEKEMPDWLKAEGPQHDVEITQDFWLGVHEVTQKQFEDVMGYNPSYFSTDGKGKEGVDYYNKPAGGKAKVPADTSSFPVENVSWEEAEEFCKKLTAMAGERGSRYRLPTEAEWEYSCRGGAPSYQVFHFGNSLSSKQANFDGNYPYGGAAKGEYLERTCTVGSYETNRFGLHDMHGNVWEWCHDWYEADYYGKSPVKDPPGPSGLGSNRVIRGGSWGSSGQDCRSARRIRGTPGNRNDGLGFRVALVPSGR